MKVLRSSLSYGCRGLGMTLGSLLVLSAVSSTALAVDIPGAVPEIDPASLSTAVAMLLGGTMLFTHSKKK